MNDGKFRIGLIKKSNGEAIPEDEPVFILRARDKYALDTLKFYLELSKREGCNDYHEDGVLGAIGRFSDWKRENPGKIKEPGVTRGI